MFYKVMISGCLIEDMLRSGYEVRQSIVKQGLPKGARLVNIGQIKNTKNIETVILYFEHGPYSSVVEELDIIINTTGVE